MVVEEVEVVVEEEKEGTEAKMEELEEVEAEA